MFRESLLETSATAIAQRSWATMMSFALEMVGVGILVLIPMAITQNLPLVNYQTIITAPLAAPPSAPNETVDSEPGTPDGDDGVFREPAQVPIHIKTGPDPRRHGYGIPVCTDCVPGGMPWNGYGPGSGGLPPDLFKPGVAPVPPPPSKPIPVSRVDEGMILSRIQPSYPPLARAARIEGPVVLGAIIGRDGRIENLRLISGHPMLTRAAIEAVSQWRYRPYVLNGQPVEVDTTITVKFSLRQD